MTTVRKRVRKREFESHERDEASFEYRSGAPSKEKRFGEQKVIGCPVRRASRSEAVERFDPEG